MTRLLIVNPFASGVDSHRLAAVQAALPAGTETRLTTAAGEATEIARETRAAWTRSTFWAATARTTKC